MKKMRVGLMVAGLVSVFAFSANALTLSSVEGVWSNVSNGENVSFVDDVSSGYGNGLEDQVRWSYPGKNSGIDENSGLGFTGAASGTSFNPGEVFEIGQLRHFNYPVNVAAAADGVKLSLNLAFSDPVGIAKTFDFDIAIDETPNSTGDNVKDSDYIDFPYAFSPETFNIGSTLYTLEIVGFKTDLSSDIVEQFKSPEHAANSAILYGKITTVEIPSEVPEPGTLLLIGLGIVGLAGLRRKQRK